MPLLLVRPGATLAAMLGRLFKWAGILLGAALASPTASVSAAAPPARVVAAAHLRGGYSAFSDTVRGAGLVDAASHWAGGKTVLVQLGDIAARGPDSLK